MSKIVLVLAIASALVVAILGVTGVLAAAPDGASPHSIDVNLMRNGNDNGVTISAIVTDSTGQAVGLRAVDFYDMADFFGPRSVQIGSAVTNANGVATLNYTPTWTGEHSITVRAQDDDSVQGTISLAVNEAPPPYESHRPGLTAVRKWAPLAAAGIGVLVWLLLGMVAVRVLRGISSARAGVARFPNLSRPSLAEKKSLNQGF